MEIRGLSIFERQGREVNNYFSQIREEALSCRNNVALFNMSYFGKFYLCGPEAGKAADYLFTSRMDREINRIVYTCMLNGNGGVESDCTVTALEAGSGGIVDPIFQGTAFFIGIVTSMQIEKFALNLT